MAVLRVWCGIVLCLVSMSGCATITGRRTDSSGRTGSGRVDDSARGSWSMGSWKWPPWGSMGAKPARKVKRPSMWQKMKRGTNRFFGRTKDMLTPGPAPQVDQSTSSVTDFLRQPKVMPDS